MKLKLYVACFDTTQYSAHLGQTRLLMNDAGEVQGVKVRKSDGRLSNVTGKKTMLACGGFEGSI